MEAGGWQLEMGAQVIDGGRVRFRVWAPAAHTVEVETYPPPEGIDRHPMADEGGGVWSATVEAKPDALYRYRLNEEWGYPDPYSRSQPEGVHGPSQVVDPNAFAWTDGGWRGLDPEALVIYELHVGAYTPEGTFDALIEQLDGLRALGVTALELMPVSEFPGRRNWGYDGVDLFAPSSVYGGPEALRRLVDAAHARGLGVILDAVYNHLGPDGNYLGVYSPHYFTNRYQTPWGDAMNFDGEGSEHVRRFVVDNALSWLHEYHIDGFRLDATHEIFDESDEHILAELARTVRERGPADRRALIIAEHERSDLRSVLPRAEGGHGLDGLWLDDFHHSLHVLLTGEKRGYLGRFDGSTAELASLLSNGTVYDNPPGARGNVSPRQLVYCLQNHDQVGNRPLGERLAHLIDRERYKAAYALLLLAPGTPLLFMGDEFAAGSPFRYFTDHQPELAERIHAGRREEFRAFWAAHGGDETALPDPQAEESFLRSRLDLSERKRSPHSGIYRLFRELLRLRREAPAFREQDRSRIRAHAVSEHAIGLARLVEHGRRLLLVNFGDAIDIDVGEQAWLGESAGRSWRPILTTVEERFAGPGADLQALALDPGRAVLLPAASATVWSAGHGR